ncbi:glutamate-5-semialdehyde dehydrogenase [Kineothrix sp. MB12-C1]|uniref:glutamate-5-semialdehyde dehydrogenase n=1 Tax=Kineothrix sp. MB12-C1 TaxID=3070215 RepID=UPI0027D256C7|nr:glutamate-5-semialdehyde dehydrogenase [Kineothrix sp. MB12-C1]WMC92489.1 glutamate-5-semialdehyde dehydrogenase [Kineothrix sp. MB12-C1]
MISLEMMGQKAEAASFELQGLSKEKKNEVLQKTGETLIADTESILKENEKDIANGESNGMHPGMVDRLRLTADRIKSMAEGLYQIVELEDPIGEVLETYDRPNGLHIQKRRVPLGVVGIIYESRPNVTADAFGLCFKSGNAVILKGGSDAVCSNIAIAASIRKALRSCGVCEDAIQLIESTDREVTKQFMKLNRYVNVLIPRGSAGLIRSVVENSTIPVIETGTGNCHIYVDESADLEKAVPIIVNAKTQRIGVCNACESLLVHEAVRERFLPMIAEAFREYKVEMRGDERTREVIADAIPATEEDYEREYLDYIIAIKTVSSIEEAIAHINRYNTKHSEAILTQNKENADKFLREVDAACVYANASTRFSDGFEFGFGAEIGISTQKLHARGPMGLKELTSYKYTIEGDWHVRP